MTSYKEPQRYSEFQSIAYLMRALAQRCQSTAGDVKTDDPGLALYFQGMGDMAKVASGIMERQSSQSQMPPSEYVQTVVPALEQQIEMVARMATSLINGGKGEEDMPTLERITGQGGGD